MSVYRTTGPLVSLCCSYVLAYLEPEDERLLDEESTSLNDAKR